jgi:bifunctional non-homologous end joining protein LigD
MTDDLNEYRGKRDLEKSGEPGPQRRQGLGPLTFVVQKHRASRLHYDVRLEVDGVLKSWAVPKGPSRDPGQKRLAAMVEDHPIDYASFEGAIPGGEYGAGEVIVWDNGTYSPDEGGRFLFGDRDAAEAEMRKGLEAGKISIHLRGHKMKGSWTLVKVRSREKDWLLIKHHDGFAHTEGDMLDEASSVISGRTIADIKAGTGRDTVGRAKLNVAEVAGARPAAFPGFVPPMLASPAAAPFSDREWVFEPKLDGYRIVALVRNGEASLWSRGGTNVTVKYASPAEGLGRQPASEVVLDGEMVALDAAGEISFERLQEYLGQPGGRRGGGPIPIVYYVFDMVFLDGYDLTDVPWRARKALLSAVLSESDTVRLVQSFDDDGKTVFEASVKSGMEGVIAKKADSLYQPARRSREWLKIKAGQTGDFIVGGYTAGEGSRAGSPGALMLGYLDKERLVYAGNVGSGLSEDTLARIKEGLDQIRTENSPFDREPPGSGPRTWVRPEMVVEVKYSQWTRDGRLRAPVFVRLRDDKAAAGVGRPEVVKAPLQAGGSEGVRTGEGLVEQLVAGGGNFSINVEGDRVVLSNVDKVLWPATAGHPALTKRHLLIYLAQVARWLLPHLQDRPLTLSRYPDGINGEHFWQKHWSHAVPPFVRTVEIGEESGKKGEYLVCDNLATLMWLGQVADIELHTWYSRTTTGRSRTSISRSRTPADRSGAELGPEVGGGEAADPLDYPDFIVFDLDPYIYSGGERAGAEPELNRAAFVRVCEVAVWLKEVLDGLSLRAFVKTSGKTGLHVYVPVVRNLEFGPARRAAETIGQFLMQRHPDVITMEWATEKRTGKVFIDYGQNVRGKTLASVYSPRPGGEAGVSFPLRWEELGKVYPDDFTMLTAPKLLQERGDLWQDVLTDKRDLGEMLGEGRQ